MVDELPPPIRAAAPSELEVVRSLLCEYADSLDLDLGFQQFERELADPFESYECLLLAEHGIVALARIDAARCELKRLYVRPGGRGGGLGRRLVETLIDEARRRGYRRMLLDTLPDMVAAQALYQSLGFVDTAPYRHNPVARARFLELVL